MTRANRRGPWLPEEDQTLLQLVSSQGPNNWVRISQHMQHRSPKQCRERYHQNLKPSLNHEPISSHEGEVIEQMVNEMGKRWAEIARRLGNRSDNAVKNWWNGSMNRRKRNVVHHNHGMKGVGARMQPISATKAPKATTGRPDSHRHFSGDGYHYNSRWSEPSPHDDSLARPMLSYSDPYQNVSTPYLYPMHDISGSRDQYLPSFDHARPSGTSLTHSNAQTYQQTVEPVSSAQQQSYFDHFPPPTHMLPAQRPHEMPLTSPLAAGVSHAPSPDRAPSLVSDNQSNYSISPKTAPSPRPDMPAPIETDIQAWAQQLSQRRESAANILPQINSQGKVHPDEGYVSALPHSALLDSRLSLPLPRQSLYRHNSADQLRSGTNRSPCESGTTIPPFTQQISTQEAAESPKDTRMHLSNLLR